MNRYITKDIVRLHPPGVVQLTKEQAMSRLHLLNEVDVEQGIYKLKADAEFKRGEEFGYKGELPKGLASVMVDPAEIEEDAGADEADDKIQRICDAIAILDPDDPDQFTNAGLPQVDALEEVMGEDITAAERDAAWAQYKAQADGE